jgi:hypothetical protein
MLRPATAERLRWKNIESWEFRVIISANTSPLLNHNFKGPVKLKMWNGIKAGENQIMRNLIEILPGEGKALSSKLNLPKRCIKISNRIPPTLPPPSEGAG